MSLNGVNTDYSTYETSNVTASGSKTSGRTDKTSVSDKTFSYNDVAATYEHSADNNTSAVNRKASNAAVVAQLKADQETRMAQMQSLVTKMFSKQGITIGTADDMWKALLVATSLLMQIQLPRQKKISQKMVTGVSSRHLNESFHLHRLLLVMTKKR